MDVIPVLDLKGGLVVQGFRGEREKYKPIRSQVVDGAQPMAVAEVLQRLTGSATMYAADLDAIQAAGDHRPALAALRQGLGARLWVDAGVADAATASALAATADRVVVGTETLPDLDALRSVRDALTPERMLVSIDIGAEGVLSRCPTLAGLPAADVLDLLAGERIHSVILLPLAKVGTGEGPDVATLRRARIAHPASFLVAGGGVRGRTDLEDLAAAGADAVLVATALHRRWITPEDVAAVRS